ncbi:MAG: hypothetical protein OEZ04_13655, partial [Nitrospinota bacterium]|nr:hypothetical protein [Nitrospinota bacterium]
GRSDYVTYTPDGYYTASPDGQKYVSWRVGDKVYSYEEYEEQFNLPDMVAASIVGETADP